MPYIGPGPSDDTPKDLNGGKLKLDADSDTSITADTDDQIDIEIAGADDFRFTANNFNVLFYNWNHYSSPSKVSAISMFPLILTFVT